MPDTNLTTTLDAAMADPIIQTAAERVARTKAELADRAAVTKQVRETVQQLASRIAAIDACRAEIAKRRKRGDCHPGDIGSLDALAIDREGLAEMKAEADTLLAQRSGEEDGARRALAEASAALSYAENTVTFAALNEHAQHLLDLLTATMAQAAKVGQHIEGHAAIAPLMTRADRIGVILGDAIGHLGEAGRRIGATDFRWVPRSDLMDLLRETTIRGRPR